MRKAKSDGRDWFVVYSDYGYFTGLADGGKLQWSLDENDAKPLDGRIAKFDQFFADSQKIMLVTGTLAVIGCIGLLVFYPPLAFIVV